MIPKNTFVLMSTILFRKCILVLLILLLTAFEISSQTVKYDNVPADLQLYPRNAQDSASVIFSGEVQTTGYDSMYIEMFKNEVLQTRRSQPLIYVAGKAPFSLTHKIHAECSEYKFRVFLNTTLVRTVNNVTCGDVYLIMGQSNAIEVISTFTYTNEYCRTFGVHTGTYNGDPYNPADTLWALSQASIGGLTPGKPVVGVWGLQLQKIIKETYNLPTCFINGGRASGFLSIQLRNNSNPEDLTSIYGRLLYRVRKAHVANNIKSIIWYGGESDGYPPGYENYLANWSIIHNQWQENYSGYSKIFAMQVRPGCSSGEELDQLREKQRQVGLLYPDVELFSTSGISQHYGCHYGPNGYIELSTFLMRNIAKEYYNGTDTVNILPPNIKRAFYNDTRTKIKILFEGSRIQAWPSDTVYGDVTVVNHSMKDYFYLNGVHGNVSGGTVSGDTLILNLISPSFANKISYLPASRDHTDQQVYEGPFLRNPRRLGALTFYDFPIADSFVTSVSLLHLIYSVNNRDVTLHWTTVSEDNNAGFEIYRTQKNENNIWTKIGYVKGNGTTTTPVEYFYNDRGLNSGRYNYKIKQIDYNGNFEFFNLNTEIIIGVPSKFLLYQNFPNPFNPNTKIEFDTPVESTVTMKLFDISGKEIKTILQDNLAAGYHIVTLNSSDLSSGVYYYTINAAGNNQSYVFSRKMVVLK